MSPPTAEGGALRSQDVRTTGDPTGLNGAILRVDPATGAGLPDNPMASSSDANARRIVGYGLRNPFRITVRPGTNEVWLGDVGWNDWEEIDRLVSPTATPVDNFGWPCYEGDGRQGGYDAANLSICENLYTEGTAAVVAPYFRYHHNELVVPNEVCPKGGSSVAGTSFAFSSGGSYPAEYRSALFFADYTRRCIWAMPDRRERAARHLEAPARSSAAPPNPSTSRSDPAAISSTWTSAAPSAASATSTRTSHQSPSPPPTRRMGPRR